VGKDSSLHFSRDRRRAWWARWPVFLVLALGLHLAVIAGLALLPARPREKKRPLPPVRHVVQLQRAAADSPGPPRPSGIVSTEDNSAERDTVKDEPRVKPRPAVSPRPRRPRPAPPAPPVPPPAAPSPEEAARPAVSVERPAEREAEAPSAPVKLFPTPEEAERILGITPETVPDAAPGKENAINSQKWLGASFFLRVREAVAQAWDPERVYRAHDPDGRVYGYKNWFTVLSITLDANGRLLEPVIIAQPSGLRFLDLEAIRAVRAAAPFLHPPKEIADPATGRIKFRFGFLVEVNAGLNFRMFRF
jgi:TonB family protein